ncbi:MAG: IS5 family transposase [Comamonas sp.]|nr:IS5 family transposase [Comamonas sp.]
MQQFDLGLNLSIKKTRKREFLEQMQQVVPWKDLVALIAAPSSTKNSTHSRDPEMHQTKKGNQWYFGMKAHIGVDADSGLVHTVRGTAANVNDVVEANSLLHGQETDGYGDAGYQGADKRADMPAETPQRKLRWHIAMKRQKRKALDPQQPIEALQEQLEKVKSSIRAKVEHPFRVIKRQFGHVKTRYRGLRKNTQQLHTLFALANLWMARARLLTNSNFKPVMRA